MHARDVSNLPYHKSIINIIICIEYHANAYNSSTVFITFYSERYSLGTKYGKIVGFKVPYNHLSFHPSVSSIQIAYTRRDLTSNKVVVLTFGDGRKSQFTNAKPILDKYGFKASFL
jgi:peptidoglycan/xylan/chitin deacetylase (PgdA/CDA1 family)